MKFFDFFKKSFFYLLAIFVPLLIISFFFFQNLSEKINFSFKRYLAKPSPQVEVVKLPWLKTEGRFLVNEKGEKVILRGVNLASVDWGYESWHPEAIDYLAKNWQVNVIRTRIIQEEYEKDQTTFFQKLEEEFLIPARRNGLYVILHPRVRNSLTDLPDNQTTAMWRAVAEKYKDDPNILFDLLAEPHNTSQSAVINAYKQLISEVRSIRPQSLILVTGLSWGREINSYLENPLPFENIVYRSNPYNTPKMFKSLFGEIDKVYPVFFGEFGAEGFPPMSKEDVEALINYAKNNEIGWTAWNFHSLGCPCLLKNYKTFEPTEYGLIVKNALTSQ